MFIKRYFDILYVFFQLRQTDLYFLICLYLCFQFSFYYYLPSVYFLQSCRHYPPRYPQSRQGDNYGHKKSYLTFRKPVFYHAIPPISTVDMAFNLSFKAPTISLASGFPCGTTCGAAVGTCPISCGIGFVGN